MGAKEGTANSLFVFHIHLDMVSHLCACTVDGRRHLICMKIASLCFLNITLGVAAGVAVTRLSEASSTSDTSALSNLIEPLTAAFVVIGGIGTVLATSHLALTLRRARRHITRERTTSPGKLISLSKWPNFLASVLLPDEIPAAPQWQSRNQAASAMSSISTTVRTRLLRRHWLNLGLMQVWTSIATLIFGGTLVVWWQIIDPVTRGIPILLGVAFILILITMSRFLISARIDHFVEQLTEAVVESVKSDHRFGEAVELEPEAPSLEVIAGLVDSLTFDSEPAAPALQADGDVSEAVELASKRAQPAAHSVPRDQQASTPDLGAPNAIESPLAVIVSAIDSLQRQQSVMMDTMRAVADALHNTVDTHLEISQQIETARTWIPRLKDLIENMVAQNDAIERKTLQEATSLRDELRERSESQGRSIAELSVTLSRLEARIVPALRRTSSANRAITLVVERLSRIEAQSPQAASTSPEVQHSLASTEERVGAERAIVSELKQLMIDLENATGDPPLESAAHVDRT